MSVLIAYRIACRNPSSDLYHCIHLRTIWHSPDSVKDKDEQSLGCNVSAGEG